MQHVTRFASAPTKLPLRHFRKRAAELFGIADKRTFAGHGRYHSARLPLISLENRKPCIADPDFAYRASSYPQVGAVSSPASHPAEADFMGSLIATLFCTELHLGQSNSRYSNPTGPRPTLVSVIRDVHCGQRGRSIGVSRDLGGIEISTRCFPARAGALPNSLSPMVADGGAVIEPGWLNASLAYWSILLIQQNFITGVDQFRGGSFVRRGALISQKALVETTVHQNTAFLAGHVIRGRFGHSDVVFCSANACMRSG